MNIGPQRPESMIGQVIADYELTAFIGTGATGLVYRGRRVSTAPNPLEKTAREAIEFPEEAAIKLLAPPMGTTQDDMEEFQRRFLREARTLKQLHHEHILPIIDFGQDAASGYFYMILTYMAGGSLAHAIAARGPLPLEETTSILAQIADALDYAHTQGVVHRDVKPGNILLDANGAPFLSDFSIVRVLSEGTTMRTTTGRMMGTPAYMAPEQFDDSSKVGAAADIYGLGMVAYEMVTGRAAFSSTSWAQVMKQQLQDMPTLPGATRPDLPKPAEAAIMQALAKDPAQRFPSATAFAHAFSMGLQGQWAEGLMTYLAASSARPSVNHASEQTVPDAQPAPRPRRRGALWGVLGAAVALLLVCACVAAAVFAGQGGLLPIVTAFTSHTPTVGAQASATLAQTVAPTGSLTPGPKVTVSAPAKKSVTPGGSTPPPGTPPTATPIPLPTATFTPALPDLVISATASQSTDQQAHTSGNPYYFSGNHTYGNVTIQAGAWAKGIGACSGGGSGTVLFSATGTVRIDGTLAVDSEGYCGGQATQGAGGGMQGWSYAGSSQKQISANYGGGGGGATADSGGAGGGYGTAGSSPNFNSTTYDTGIIGGQTYGDPTLATLYLGSGGGSSGAQSGSSGGAGGNGGGAISITANSIIVTGTISANGGAGASVINTTNNPRGGGGGSGGSILLHANSISISGTVTATGGNGGYGNLDGTRVISGGPGGVGRIRIECSPANYSHSGSVSPGPYVG